MKLCLKLFVVALVAAFTYSLIGCAAPTGFSYQNVGITLQEFCTYTCTQVTYDPNLQLPAVSSLNIPAVPYVWQINATNYYFTATAQNAVPNFTWALYPTENLTEPNPYPTGGSATSIGEASPGPTDGYFNAGPGNTGNTVLYYTPSAPIYTGAALAQAESFKYTVSGTTQFLSPQGVPSIITNTASMTGIPQGNVLLAVSVPSSATNPAQTYTYYQLMELTTGIRSYLIPSTPTNPSGLTTPVVTVPRGTTFQFYGGAVGAGACGTVASCSLQAVGYQTLNSVDDTVLWEVGSSTSTACVNGTTGCQTTYGTISTSGLYTAPINSPTGSFPFTAVVVLAPHLALSSTQTAYITVN